MNQLEEVLKRIKSKYEIYEDERNAIEESEEGFIDISVACSLADSTPYLIKTIEKQVEEICKLKSALSNCKYHAECHNDEKGETSYAVDIIDLVDEALEEN